MAPFPDRKQLLQKQNKVTGIDFVYVHADQVTLDVFFLCSPLSLTDPLSNDLPVDRIHITGGFSSPGPAKVPVLSVNWINGQEVLRVKTVFPGGFARYRLFLDDPKNRIDPYFNNIDFSFKANCESDLDCKQPDHQCPPEERIDFPVNYLARDFGSFRRALLDFASQRYPDWKDRLETDVVMMFAEVMSASGDEFAYYQDRIGREVHFETASQRRSLRRHAQLVDYNIHDGLGAKTWIDFDVKVPSITIPAGTVIKDSGERIIFEVGNGFIDDGKNFHARLANNSLDPHIWDQNDLCLVVGATSIYINGDHTVPNHLQFDDFSIPDKPGKWVLLKTTPTSAEIPARNWMVRLTRIDKAFDPIQNQDLTRLTWETEHATPFELDLTTLKVRANLFPATAGETKRTQFLIGESTDPLWPEAVERMGAGGSVTYRFSLPESDQKDLVWLGPEPQDALPEIRLTQAKLVGGTWVPDTSWEWRRSLLGVDSSLGNDLHFTLEDGFWRRVVGYQRVGEEIVHIDYASNRGFTIRFGDGEFGLVPTSKMRFFLRYRLGEGKRTNVSVNTLTHFDQSAFPDINSVTNPLPAINGLDPETPEQVRQLAPEAFRYLTYRAVRPEDYAEAAERLSWVQRAGANVRWTGSWLTMFVTPDPLGSVAVTETQRQELAQQLDRFRQAGRECFPLAPRYVDLDLEIAICVAPSRYSGEVEEELLQLLLGKKGFFSPDRFTFGTSLNRSQLEALIQNVPGVRAVETIWMRRRGWFDWREFTEWSYPVAMNEIIRVENDPLFPERGSLNMILEGGS